MPYSEFEAVLYLNAILNLVPLYRVLKFNMVHCLLKRHLGLLLLISGALHYVSYQSVPSL